MYGREAVGSVMSASPLGEHHSRLEQPAEARPDGAVAALGPLNPSGSVLSHVQLARQRAKLLRQRACLVDLSCAPVHDERKGLPGVGSTDPWIPADEPDAD